MSRLHITVSGTASHYECEDMDAGLPLHAHAPGSPAEHDIRCDVGRLLVYLHPDGVHILEAGETLNFDNSRWHGIVPLTVGAQFTNTSRMVQDDAETVLESPHNAPEWVQRFITAILNAQNI